ncbi:metal ABC transporter permease [Erysipelothrix piscisicarius]|uniref:metal ABC transporter permease n=1 Tax=Erysipelothrix piscisicarius TaxID=2485784 RepID=UPI002F926B4A
MTISIPMQIMMIAVVVALSCSLLGVFLVLKKMAMMSDAITHTILLGIVIGFFITHDFNSPNPYLCSIHYRCTHRIPH